MRFSRLRAIPISLRVPIIVAALMLAISAAISERVLDRLSRMQESYIQGLSETYFDGLSSSLIPAVLREDVWEVFDGLDRSSSLYAAIHPSETVVADSGGRVLASTDPKVIKPYTHLTDAYRARYGEGTLTLDKGAERGFAKRNLTYQGHHIGTIYATFDVSRFMAERSDVLFTLILTNGLLAVVFAFLGFLVIRRMIGPMRVLEQHMRSTADGVPRKIPDHLVPRYDREVAKLLMGYNALVAAEQERAAFAMQLAEEEKMASLGRLASGMAHEINNPLGGLFNAIDTLKSHGEARSVRQTSISLIERGLEGIREVVGAALATYRPERSPHRLSPDDLNDVALLLRPELRRKRQRLDWSMNWGDGLRPDVPGGPMRQALLNLLLNASAATAEGGTIGVKGSIDERGVRITVTDEGPGMPDTIARLLEGRAAGTEIRNNRGLGVWIVRHIMEGVNGEVRVEKGTTGGCVVRVQVPAARRETADAA